MYSYEELSIAGHQETPVPNTFHRQENPTDHLAIILPGVAYSCDMPLLFYPTKHLLLSGADVLHVKYDYRESWGKGNLPKEKIIEHLFMDVSAAAKTALEQRNYSRLTVVGKSLGTLAIPYLQVSDLAIRPQACIYLTPVLANESFKNQVIHSNTRSLIIIGTADSYYDPAFLSEIVDSGQGDVLTIEGGDHSLEVPGGVLESIKALEMIVRKIQTFLG